MNRRNFIRIASTLGALPWLPSLVQAQQQGVFRIGSLTPLTGAGSAYGPGMQQAIELAIAEVNDAGGAAGLKLALFAEDSQTKPDAAVLAAKKLIDVNQVKALIGTWSGGVTLAVMPLTDDANIIQMNVSGASAISTQDRKDLVWRFGAPSERYGNAFAAICAERGFKRPATMAFNNASAIGSIAAFKSKWEAGGGQVVAQTVYEPNRSSYRSELQMVLAAKPDVIVTLSYLPDSTVFLREWYQSGEEVKWVMPGFAANLDLVKALGAEPCEGIISTDVTVNEAGSAFKRFDDAFRKKSGKEAASNTYAVMCYDMVITLALCIEAAGKADVAAVNSKMRTVANPPGVAVSTFAEGKALLAKQEAINYEGASSRLDFDQFGDAMPDFSVSVIEGGKLVRRGTISSES